MPHTVALVVADEVTDSGVAVTLDVLRTATAMARQAGRATRFRVVLTSARGGVIRTAGGLKLPATTPIGKLGRIDSAIVPGLWIEDRQALAARLARPDVATVAAALSRTHRLGALIATACAGTFVLAAAGLLDGRRATTTWWLADELRRHYPRIEVDERAALIVDGPVVTAGAVFAIADVALHLVTRVAGPELARRVAQVLLLDRHPSQAPYMARRHLSSDDALVRAAERWARSHLAEDFTIARWARQIGTSPRTLARRLATAASTNPIGFLQRLRVETTLQLLETSRLSLAEIAERVGYADGNTLRRVVQRIAGVTPRAVRAAAIRSAGSG